MCLFMLFAVGFGEKYFSKLTFSELKNQIKAVKARGALPELFK